MPDVVAKGTSRTVLCARLPDGSSPVAEFLNGLKEKKRIQLQVLFDRMAGEGRINNREKFKKVEGSDGVWEFKSFQTRLLCSFEPGGIVLLTNGFTKKKDRIPPSELARANKIRQQWRDARQEGTT